jgi:hypothetical protein
MKKLTILLSSLVLGFSVAGVAGATPVGFDLAGLSGSGTVGSANLASALYGSLGSQVFFLTDGQTKKIDMSSGTLKWDPKSLPDVFTVAGNSLTANVQDGLALNTLSQLPKLPSPRRPEPSPHDPPPSGGNAPVPEPCTIFLLGSGFVSLALYGRRRSRG